MVFILKKASDYKYEITIVVNTIAELMELIDKYGCPIVVDEDSITIYDDYLE